MDRFDKAVAFLMGKGHSKEEAERMVKQFPHAAEAWAQEYVFWYGRTA